MLIATYLSSIDQWYNNNRKRTNKMAVGKRANDNANFNVNVTVAGEVLYTFIPTIP